MTDSITAGEPWRDALEKDQRRIRRWMWFAGVLGVATVVKVAILLFVATHYLPYELHIFNDLGISNPPRINTEAEKDPFRKATLFTLVAVWLHSRAIILLAMAAAVLLLGNLGTIFMLLQARRATLRHVNAGMQELSDRLASLQKILERPE